MKHALIIMLISTMLCAETLKNEKLVRFDTGSSFVFIQIDEKNATFSIISEEAAIVKRDGSYCYLSDKIYDQYEDKDSFDLSEIPDKYCKDTPPYQNISKVFQTVMSDLVVLTREDVGIKPFPLDRHNVSDEMLKFFYKYGIVTNRTQEFHETFIFHTNTIELKVRGRGPANIGMCGGAAANIVDLTINGNQFFDSVYMQPCYGNDIYKIELNLKKRLITIYANDDNGGEFSFNLPFEYFNKAVRSLVDERIMYMPKRNK